MNAPKMPYPKNAVFPDVLTDLKVGDWVWLIRGRDGSAPTAHKVVKAAAKTVWIQHRRQRTDEIGRPLPDRFRRDTGQPHDPTWEGRGVKIISGRHRECFRLLEELSTYGWRWQGFIRITPEEIEAVHAAVTGNRARVRPDAALTNGD